MATKANLEACAHLYYALMERMHDARRTFAVSEAIRIAIESCKYIDGMLQYDRRYGGRADRDSIESIDYVLDFAPLVFDVQSLATVKACIKTHKRVAKSVTTDLTKKVEAADKLMWDAHRLWNHLERVGKEQRDALSLKLGEPAKPWEWITDQWLRMGVLSNVTDGPSQQIYLTTLIGAIVKAKCPSCGVVAKAAMGRFLEENLCPKCGARSYFVFVPVE